MVREDAFGLRERLWVIYDRPFLLESEQTQQAAQQEARQAMTRQQRYEEEIELEIERLEQEEEVTATVEAAHAHAPQTELRTTSPLAAAASSTRPSRTWSPMWRCAHSDATKWRRRQRDE